MHPTSHTPRGALRLAASAVATLALAAGSLACGGGGGEDTTAEAVRQAAERHVREAESQMTFDDPQGEGQLTLVYDHVHESVKDTPGGRQVVCVDFRSADGTVYDVDFYVDRAPGTEDLVVEDAVVHKMGDRNVLSEARRAELDQKG